MSKKNFLYIIFIGVLLLVLYLVYLFAKSNDWLDNSTMYKSEFENVTDLSSGAKVTMRGLHIGKVKKIYVKDSDPKHIIAEIRIKDDIKVPKNAVLAMRSAGLMDGNILDLEFDTPCKGDCAEEGYTLKNRVVGMVENTFGKTPTESELGIGKDDVMDMLDVWKKKVISDESDHIIGKTLQDMDAISKKMTSMQGEMDRVARKSGNQLEDVMGNLEGLNEIMKGDQLQQIMDDMEKISKTMDEMDLETPMNHAKSTMARAGELQKEANISMEEMKQTMDEAKVVFAELSELKEKMNNEDGSIKYILDENGLSSDLNNALTNLNQLSKDFKYKAYHFKPFLNRRKFLRKNPELRDIPE